MFQAEGIACVVLKQEESWLLSKFRDVQNGSLCDGIEDKKGLGPHRAIRYC
jgi:hypothetical protein